MKRTLLLSLSLSMVFAFAFVAHAQTDRSYHYTNFAETVTVSKDTTIRVEENQEYQFVGTYHLGYRSIPHTALDAITDVTVVDGETGQPYSFSSSKLSKDDPSSWGKYTVYEENDQTIIEWYYDLSNTTHRFIVSYTVHGALAFYKDHDELYWNVFTNYSVPVDRVEVWVRLPGAITQPTKSWYTSGNHEYISEQPNESAFHFVTTDIAPNEAVTFAVGWQKGLVNRSAYWWDFMRIYWMTITSVVLLFGSIVYSIAWWLVQEHKNRGRGTIVPEYDPPEHLPPAMADVVVHGHLSTKAWAATVVDLAVRGYVRIIEDTSGWFTNSWLGKFMSKQYIVERTEKALDDASPYESLFLEELFAVGDGKFSTREMRRNPTKGQELFKKLQKVEKILDTETVDTTHAFAVPPGKFAGKALWIVVVFSIMIIITVPSLMAQAPQMVLLLLALGASGVLVFGVRYIPRLNKQGHILKEEWLGFKMYLETAERYRMQNLTPETFEKYLPYAMIFGVEKQWARAFETLNMQPPTWYVGSNAAFVSTGSGGGFSPSSFASGFSASFASSFASSGGGGASGGGGGAGGGGGGGGGGAA